MSVKWLSVTVVLYFFFFLIRISWSVYLISYSDRFLCFCDLWILQNVLHFIPDVVLWRVHSYVFVTALLNSKNRFSPALFVMFLRCCFDYWMYESPSNYINMVLETVRVSHRLPLLLRTGSSRLTLLWGELWQLLLLQRVKDERTSGDLEM